MLRGRRNPSLTALPAALVLAGCGANLVETASLAISPAASVHAEPPVEIYSRIARGALACWFGPNGSLKRSHVFHADVAPEAKGGEAEIVLHERDDLAPSPRSLRAYRIAISRSGGGSSVLTERLKLPEAVARDMNGDVRRWASGGTGCSVVGVGGWSAAGAPATNGPEAPANKPAAAPKKR